MELARSLDPGLKASLSPAPDRVQEIHKGRKKLDFTQKVSKRGEGSCVRNLKMENCEGVLIQLQFNNKKAPATLDRELMCMYRSVCACALAPTIRGKRGKIMKAQNMM